MSDKANVAANLDGKAVFIPQGAFFITGEPFMPHLGGVVKLPDGTLLSVAAPTAVPDARYSGPRFVPFKGHLIQPNRVGRLLLGTNELPVLSHGFEWELTVVDEKTGEVKPVSKLHPDGSTEFTGKLASFDCEYAKITLEAQKYIVEMGVEPAQSIDELTYNMILGTGAVVDAIRADGGMPVPTDVVGHRKMGRLQRSTDRYLNDTVEALASCGEFTEDFPIDTFLVAWAAQFLRDIRNTEAAIHAAYFMQIANVVLAAIGVNGPFFMGTRKILEAPDFGERQWEILATRGLSKCDFIGERLSWRGTLLNVISPSAGTWRNMPPHDIPGFLDYLHKGLRVENASTSDRVIAMHGDRLRFTMGKTGLFENLSQPNVPSLHSQISAMVVWNAMFTSVEEMIMKGEDPRDIAPNLFGSNLEQARRERLLTDKFGADVRRNGKPLYELWNEVMRVATYSRLNSIPSFYSDWHKRAYASGSETRRAIRSWCAATGKPPGMQTYHEIGVGAPAHYAIAHYEYLRERYPEMSEADIIRDCNLDNGRAFVREVESAMNSFERRRWLY